MTNSNTGAGMDGGDTPEVRSPEKILLQNTQGTPQAPISPYQERRGTSNSINNTNTRKPGGDDDAGLIGGDDDSMGELVDGMNVQIQSTMTDGLVTST